MSIVAHSPFTGNKRLFDEDASSDSFDRNTTSKRSRVLGSPSGCRRASPAVFQAEHPFHPTTLAALRALFPGMDEQAVTMVLAECGNDIDAAIRRLTELKIESAEQPTAAQSPAPQPAAGPSGRQQDNFRHGGEASSSAGPQTADGWVDGLVQEMAAAKDMADAKTRATKVLHSFEQFVSERVKKNGGGEAAQQSRLEEALRENVILKRAVQIQNARMQEAGQKEAELAGLRQMVNQYQERLRALELSNYSLALHLQKATDSAAVPTSNHRPDVF